jgi:hypothetical protein
VDSRDELGAKHDIAVLAPVASLDMNDHPLAVDIADLQVRHFCATKITDTELQASHQGIKPSKPTPASGIKMHIHLGGYSEIEFENAARMRLATARVFIHSSDNRDSLPFGKLNGATVKDVNKI